MIHNKLVRDRIPEIIATEGKTAKTRILDEQEYRQELIKKLAEETAEFEADPSLEELADIQEVVLGLLDTIEASKDELETVRAKKAQERGVFVQRIYLESAE